MSFNEIIGIVFQLLFLASLFIGAEFTEEPQLLKVNNSNALRTVCCVIVVLSHIGCTFSYCALGYLHFIAVACFFLLSGFGLSYSAFTKPRYLNRFHIRFIKILVPYLIVVALKLILRCDVSSGGLYYVNVLLLFYVLFFLSYRFGSKYKNIILTISIIAYSALTQQFHDLVMPDARGIMQFFGWGNQSLFFILGIFIAVYYEAINTFIDKWKKLLLSLMVMASGVLGISYLSLRTIMNITWNAYFIRVGLIFSVLTVMFCSFNHTKLNNKLFIGGGSISYYVFLLHGMIIQILERYSSQIDSTPLIKVLCVFILSVFGAILLKCIMQRISCICNNNFCDLFTKKRKL